jgi:hypothetical protein
VWLQLEFSPVASVVATSVVATEIFSVARVVATDTFFSFNSGCNLEFFQLEVWLQLSFSRVVSAIATESFSNRVFLVTSGIPIMVFEFQVDV